MTHVTDIADAVNSAADVIAAKADIEQTKKLLPKISYKQIGVADALVTIDGAEVVDCDGFTLKHDAGGFPQVELSFVIVKGTGSIDFSDLEAEVTARESALVLPQPRTTQPGAFSTMNMGAPRIALMRDGSLDGKAKYIPSEPSHHYAMCVRFPGVESVIRGVTTVRDEFYIVIMDDGDVRSYDRMLHYQYVGTTSPYDNDAPWTGAITWAQADAIHNGGSVAVALREQREFYDTRRAERLQAQREAVDANGEAHTKT